MKILISNTSENPLYQQIKDQIKDAILKEELVEGDPLPSIRAFANDLSVSVLTIRRVYEELEKEGFIYTIAAKGCFVAPLNTDLLRETNLKKIEDYMEKIVHLAASCNLSEQELTEMLHFMMEE